MKKSPLLGLALAFIPLLATASPYVYDFTEFGLFTSEIGDFDPALPGDEYSANGLFAQHTQRYPNRFAAELGGYYSRNSLNIGSNELPFTAIGINAALGYVLPLTTRVEIAGFVGGNYDSLESDEFTESDTFFFGRARASFKLTESLYADLQYQANNKEPENESWGSVIVSWSGSSQLKVAAEHHSLLSANDTRSSVRVAWQTAPDAEWFTRFSSSSHSNGNDSSRIELGYRILIGSAPVRSSGENPDETELERLRREADELRRDLPPELRQTR